MQGHGRSVQRDLLLSDEPAALLVSVSVDIESRLSPRTTRSRQLEGRLRTTAGFFERDSGHGRQPALPVPSGVTAHQSSSQRGDPVSDPRTPNLAQLPSLASGLSMLCAVAAHLRLRSVFQRRGWSFPSSVAGMLGLFAGTILRVHVHREKAGIGTQASEAHEECSTRKCLSIPVHTMPFTLETVR